MNKCFKLTGLTLACGLSLWLTACQKDTPHHGHGDPAHHKPPHHGAPPHLGPDGQALSKQDKKQFQQHLAEFKAQREAADKNCADKIGQTVSIQIHNQSIDGKCLVTFQPKPPKKHAKHPPHAHAAMAETPKRPDPKTLSDEDKRQFEQHLKQQQAQRQAFDQACADRIGQQINIKFQDKIIEGRCLVSFQPDHPPKMMPPPAQPAS